MHLPHERVSVRQMRDRLECGGYELPAYLDVEDTIHDLPGGTGNWGRGGKRRSEVLAGGEVSGESGGGGGVLLRGGRGCREREQ